MAGIATMEIKVIAAKYMFVFFPFATFTRIGDISKLTVFGIPVYRRVNDIRNVLWITYRRK